MNDYWEANRNSQSVVKSLEKTNDKYFFLRDSTSYVIQCDENIEKFFTD